MAVFLYPIIDILDQSNLKTYMVVSIYCRKKIIGDSPVFLIVIDLLYSLRPQKCLISFLEDKKKHWEALHPIPDLPF